MRIKSHNSRSEGRLAWIVHIEGRGIGWVLLIRLCDISEDNIDHRNEHSVSKWVTGIFDDGDHISAMSSLRYLRVSLLFIDVP